jgi:hypothetical protein
MKRRDFLRALRGTPAAFLLAKYGAPRPEGRWDYVRVTDERGRRLFAITWNLEVYGRPNLERMALAK